MGCTQSKEKKKGFSLSDLENLIDRIGEDITKIPVIHRGFEKTPANVDTGMKENLDNYFRATGKVQSDRLDVHETLYVKMCNMTKIVNSSKLITKHQKESFGILRSSLDRAKDKAYIYDGILSDGCIREQTVHRDEWWKDPRHPYWGK